LRIAVEHAHAYLLLQEADPSAHGWLRDAAEVTVLGHRIEVADQPQIDVRPRRRRISHELTRIREPLGCGV